MTYNITRDLFLVDLSASIVIICVLILIFRETDARQLFMYREYFGLKETPFSIAPDPRYLYMSEGHREALAHLEYGLRGEGGFVLLTGEVGTGKTTVCRRLLEQLPDDLDVAFILNPRVTVGELLATICDELGIAYPEANVSVKVFVDRINEFLIGACAKGRRSVLIIEEAQNLHFDVLEQLRLLTNLETNERKLLQIIMVGQPELRDMLEKPELRQLAQRITARYHLGPLSCEEVSCYIFHRLSVAGGSRTLFPAAELKRLFRLTGGIPRLINVICDRALLGAYVQGKDRVDTDTLATAAREVSGDERRTLLTAGYEKLLTGVMIIIFGIALSAIYYHLRAERPGETAGLADPGRMNGQVSESPRLDTLWWFDQRSFLWRDKKRRGVAIPSEDQWALPARPGRHSASGEHGGERADDGTGVTARQTGD